MVIDALVVGGGPAGLAAALWLGRNRCHTVVADRGEPRNRWVDASFGYLGFDGRPPGDLLAAGRAELARYDEVSLVDDGVRTIHRIDGDDGRFEAEVGDRSFVARCVVIATGVRDAVPPLPGLGRFYGKQVFVCPLCDGYEVREQRVVVLGDGGPFAEELRTWAASVDVVPMGDAAAVEGSDRLEGIRRVDGSVVACDAVFLDTAVVAVTDLAAHLGCERNDEGLLVVDAEGATTVDGVFAAGDCTPGPQLVQVAAAEGARAGLRCASRLRDWGA